MGAWIAVATLMVAGCSDDAAPPPPDGPTTKVDGPTTKTDGPGTTGDGPATKTDGPATKTDGPATKTDGPATKTDGLSIGDTTCNPAWGAADACGGNLVKTWKYKSVCVAGGFFSAITTLCPTATLSNQAATGSGTLTFTATTFTRAVTGTVTTDATIPQSCAIGGCNVLETTIKAVVPGATATCTGASSAACSCKLGVPISLADTGTYTVAASIVTAIPSGGAPSQYHFCIKDNVLRYRGLATNLAGQKDVVHVLTP